ncbi:MAG: HIT family protein [archaeon]
MAKDKNCIFCKIIKKEIPVDIIFESDKCIAIPDKFPGTKGQVLVISKKHAPYIFDLSETIFTDLFKASRKIGRAIDEAFPSERTCILVEGFDVPHVHVRIHPTYGKGLIRNGDEASNEEIKEVVKKIKEKL